MQPVYTGTSSNPQVREGQLPSGGGVPELRPLYRVVHRDECRELLKYEDSDYAELRLRIRPYRDMGNSFAYVISLYRKDRLLELYIVRDNWYGSGRDTDVSRKIRETRRIYEKISKVQTVDEFKRLYEELKKEYGGVE